MPSTPRVHAVGVHKGAVLRAAEDSFDPAVGNGRATPAPPLNLAVVIHIIGRMNNNGAVTNVVVGALEAIETERLAVLADIFFLNEISTERTHFRIGHVGKLLREPIVVGIRTRAVR